MQRHATIVALALGLCAASCQAEPGTAPAVARARCDLEALERAAETVASARGYSRATSAWTGIEAACRPALPEVVGMYFDDLIEAGPPRDWDVYADAFTAFETQVCPEWPHVARALEGAPPKDRARIVYERCNMARFGVLAPRELGARSPGVMTWGVHALLLEQGLPRHSARTLTRALYTLEQLGRPPVERVPELRWPQAEGVAIEQGMFVYLSRTQLRVGDWAVELDALLDDADARGDLDVRLARLRQTSRAAPVLIVVADADTPQRVLRVVLESARRVEIQELGLFLDPLADAWSYMPLPPLVSSLPAPEEPRARVDELARARTLARTLTVEYGPQGYTFMRGDQREAEPVEHPSDERQALLDAIASLSASGTVQVVVGVGDEVRARALVELIAALRRPNCELRGEWCFVSTLGLVAGERAHDFEPDYTRNLHDIAVAQRELEASDEPVPSRLLPTVVLGEVEVEGSLDADLVRRIVRVHVMRLRECYAIGMVDDPDLAGELSVAFTVGRTGEVTEVEVSSKTFTHAGVTECVTKAVQRWKFSRLANGEEARVVYPMVLDPKLEG